MIHDVPSHLLIHLGYMVFLRGTNRHQAKSRKRRQGRRRLGIAHYPYLSTVASAGQNEVGGDEGTGQVWRR